jgi:hypothetical protein
VRLRLRLRRRGGPELLHHGRHCSQLVASQGTHTTSCRCWSWKLASDAMAVASASERES